MPVSNFNNLCLPLKIGSGDHCIRMPGGTELCVNFPGIVPPTLAELMQQMFAQLNSAMAPLQPIFNIIDAVVQVFECIKAISTLDVEEILACIPGLTEKINKLLGLIPVLSLPLMIIDIIDCIILFLQGLQQQLQSMQEFLNRVLAAELASAEAGNVGVGVAIDCAKGSIDAQLEFMNENAKPVNRLIGIINFFLELIGVSNCIPAIGAVSVDVIEPFLNLLQILIDFLELLRSFISIPAIPQLNSKECEP